MPYIDYKQFWRFNFLDIWTLNAFTETRMKYSDDYQYVCMCVRSL